MRKKLVCRNKPPQLCWDRGKRLENRLVCTGKAGTWVQILQGIMREVHLSRDRVHFILYAKYVKYGVVKDPFFSWHKAGVVSLFPMISSRFAFKIRLLFAESEETLSKQATTALQWSPSSTACMGRWQKENYCQLNRDLHCCRSLHRKSVVGSSDLTIPRSSGFPDYIEHKQWNGSLLKIVSSTSHAFMPGMTISKLCEGLPELATHHPSVFESPVSVAHCAPLVVFEHFHAATVVGWSAAGQAHWNRWKNLNTVERTQMWSLS